MKQFKRRIEALESAAGQADDDSFCAQVARAHARGESIPCITVQPGETVEEVRAREGYSEDGPLIVNVIVRPGDEIGEFEVSE